MITLSSMKTRIKYRFRGFEVSIHTRPFKGLFLSSGYTYMDADNVSSDSDIDIVQHRPRHKLTFNGSYQFDFGLTATVTVLHVNRQFFFSKNEPYETKQLNEYTLVNFKVSQTFQKHFTLYFGADNMFDNDYEMSYGLPRPGRFVYGGIKIKY